MARKIPQRSGVAVSNADRLDRSQKFTASASRYAGVVPVAEEGRTGVPDGAVSPAVLPVESEDSREVRKAREPEVGCPDVGGVCDTKVAEQDQPGRSTPLTYYVRIGKEDAAMLAQLSERTGFAEPYLKRALAKATRHHLAGLRDRGAWRDLAEAARPRLDEPKGSGAPFLKSMIRLTAVQEQVLRASIDDPLEVFGTTLLLSAYGKAVLTVEIARLARLLSGSEIPATDPGRA